MCDLAIVKSQKTNIFNAHFIF